MCVLGATALSLAAVEVDGLPPPASVSVVGTGLGAALLSAAALADRRWWHLGGVWIGVGVAVCVVVAGPWAARRRGVTLTPLWPLLPAGAVMGWVGAVGAALGVGTSAVFLVGTSAFLRTRTRPGHLRELSGLALAAAVGSAAAVVGAFVAGTSIGP
jgi:hypothetical protein